MPATTLVPSIADLRQTLEMLLGDGLHIAEAMPHESAEQAEFFAVYINDDNEPIAVCGSNTLFAAYSGACLSRIPAHIAQEAAKNNDLSPMMVDNFYEVMNICSHLLMDNHTPHLRLDKVKPKAQMNGDLQSMKVFNSFHVEIPNYGKGTLAFFAVPNPT